MKQINILIALKSVIELERLLNFNLLISELSDKYLRKKLTSELQRSNFGNIKTIIDKYLFDNFEYLLIYKLEDIKQFDFDIISCNINELKNALGVSKLSFYAFKNKEGKDTDYGRYWNNPNRFAVFCKKDLIETIKKDPEYLLYVEKEIKDGELGKYTKFTIYSLKEIERLNHFREEERSPLDEYENWYLDAYDNDETFLWNND